VHGRSSRIWSVDWAQKLKNGQLTLRSPKLKNGQLTPNGPKFGGCSFAPPPLHFLNFGPGELPIDRPYPATYYLRSERRTAIPSNESRVSKMRGFILEQNDT